MSSHRPTHSMKGVEMESERVIKREENNFLKKIENQMAIEKAIYIGKRRPMFEHKSKRSLASYNVSPINSKPVIVLLKPDENRRKFNF